MNHPNSFESWRKVFVLSAAFLLVLAVGAGCKKKQSPIGGDALDPDDLLSSGGVDTFQLYTFSETDDSIRTDDQLFALLGAYHDPKMGTFAASFYTQIRTSGTLSIPQTATIVVDSVVLALEYGGYYGKLDAQTFEVYRLDDSLGIATSYYADDTKPHLGGNLMDPNYSATITPDPTGEVILGEDTTQAQLRLHLDPSLGLNLLQDAQNGNAAFTDNTIFTNEYFKGLHVKVTNENPGYGMGGVFYFRTNDPNTKLTVYYHLQGETDPLEYDFLINNNCADFNHVTINNAGYDVQTIIDNPDNNDRKQFYAQAFKTRAGIRLPGLDQLPKNAIIHDALLVLPISYQAGTSYYPSTTILAGYKNDEGNVIGFDDIAYDPNSRSYRVSIRNYVQSVVLGDADNTGLYFYPLFMGGTSDRIIFNGPNTTNKDKPKLIVKYTEY